MTLPPPSERKCPERLTGPLFLKPLAAFPEVTLQPRCLKTLLLHLTKMLFTPLPHLRPQVGHHLCTQIRTGPVVQRLPVISPYGKMPTS